MLHLRLSPGWGYRYWSLLVLRSNHGTSAASPRMRYSSEGNGKIYIIFYQHFYIERERHCQNPQGISCTRDPWITKHKLHSSTWMILMFFPALHWQTQITDFAQNHWKPSFFRVLAVNSSDYIGNVLGSWKMHELLINEAFCLHLHIHKGVVE